MPAGGVQRCHLAQGECGKCAIPAGVSGGGNKCEVKVA